MTIFTELTLILLVALVMSLVMRRLRQPLIVGYIASGVLVGPFFLNLIQARDEIELFSKIGITILLFIVGLNLNPKVIREVGKASLVTGIGQVVFTSLVGFVIASWLGIDRLAAIYVAIALTFSSTIIILKLLSDRGDLTKLYGKIAIGFLLVQDIVAVVILLFVSSFSSVDKLGFWALLGLLLLKAALIGVFVFLINEVVFPKLGQFIAVSQELLFLFSLAFGLGMATLFYSAGFSIEIGALIAGVMLSMTSFAYEVEARLKPLRDFFIILFFILLGSQMVFSDVVSLFVPALVLSVFVLVGNPVIVVVLMNLLGYKRRVGFMAGLTVAQISEFSLILATLGFNLGHLSRDVLTLVTLVGLISIVGSTYFILYADSIFIRVEWLLKLLELRKKKLTDKGVIEEQFEVVLFGYDRVGEDFVKVFRKLGVAFLVVDYNPESIRRLEGEGVPSRFGDAEDPEFLEELGLSKMKLVVSTIPDYKTNGLLIQSVLKDSPRAIVIPISHNVSEAMGLYDLGASYVVMPHYLGARYASGMIGRFGLAKDSYRVEKAKHLSHIQSRLS